jgi:hypothetical protein
VTIFEAMGRPGANGLKIATRVNRGLLKAKIEGILVKTRYTRVGIIVSDADSAKLTN